MSAEKYGWVQMSSARRAGTVKLIWVALLIVGSVILSAKFTLAPASRAQRRDLVV